MTIKSPKTVVELTWDGRYFYESGWLIHSFSVRLSVCLQRYCNKDFASDQSWGMTAAAAPDPLDLEAETIHILLSHRLCVSPSLIWFWLRLFVSLVF